MTVTVNATATTATQTTGAGTITNTTLTIASGATALLAFYAGAFGADATAMVWDSTGTPQSLTKLATVDNVNSVSVSLWGLVSPTLGNKTLSATLPSANGGVLDAIAFAGTDTSSIANCFQAANTSTGASGTSTTLTGTSAVGNINCCVLGNQFQNIAGLTATSSTNVFIAVNNNGAAGSLAPGAPSVAWTGSQTSDSWGMACVDVAVPAGAVATVQPFTRWAQLGPLAAQ